MAAEQAGPATPEDTAARAAPNPLEKVWAVAGLLAGVVLAWMAIDLLRGPRIPDETGDGDG
jgi:hypothetical protein